MDITTARSLANKLLALGGSEGQNFTIDQTALLAVTYAVIALTEQVRDTNTNTNSILEDIARYVGIDYRRQEENAELLAKIHELETYAGPPCKHCGSAHLIPISTRVQCPQCMKIQVVK